MTDSFSWLSTSNLMELRDNNEPVVKSCFNMLIHVQLTGGGGGAPGAAGAGGAVLSAGAA